MKEVLALVEQRKQEFAKLPFFEFLQDTTIDPMQRLAWIPCIAPFAMEFCQFNRYDIRKEPTTDPIQAIINIHTYEEEDHWTWFLEDIEKLGLNKSMSFTDALRFIWSEETQKTRQICHQIALYTFQAEPVIVLVALEAVEATGNVGLALTTKVTQELKQTTNKNYRYFGQHHFHVENNHSNQTYKLQEFIAGIELTKSQKTKAFEIVEKVFELFTEAVNEMMEYAEKYPITQTLIAR